MRALGRDIPTDARELLAGRCALVVWDMQVGIAPRATTYRELLSNVRTLVDTARSNSTPVIYSQHFSVPLELEDPVWLRAVWRAAGSPDPSALRAPYLPGSAPWGFVPDVAPEHGDIVLAKTRPSFFIGTPLRPLLAANDIRTIVIAGVATDRGVLTTARDAVNLGVFPVVVADAVGAFSARGHERGLEQLREFADVCATADVLAVWRAKES